MDGSVAEGISTSSQTCLPLSQSRDLQELYTPEGLPSPPSFCHLHVNDLGLTPTPGSQQQKPVDTSHVSSGDENFDLSDEGAAVADKSTTKDPKQKGEDLSTDTGEILYDPLFDAGFGLQDLESAFLSHKRAHDEAFPEDFGFGEPPEKRQTQDPSNSTGTLSDEIPSLSPDSFHRPDQVDTALNTPTGIERSQTPNSFFDSFDLLLQDSAFSTSLEGDDFAANTLFDDLPIRPNHEVSHALEAVPTSTSVVEPTTAPLPSISDTTRQRFSLDAQDLVASKSKEVLRRADTVPQYSSPYPAYGGPLGYLPSGPGLHAKCVEVADERMNFRIECLRDKNQQLTTERNKYKHFFDEFSTVDQATGKTKQQLLLEENSTLRRVSTRHQTRVEHCKKETEHWKGKLNEVATMYNNLLYEIAVQRKLPEVAPPPPRYKPRPVQGVLVPGQHAVSHQSPAVPNPNPRPESQPSVPRAQPAPTQHPAIGVSQHAFPRAVTQQPLGTATPSANQPPSQPPCRPTPAPTDSRNSQAVTIDLTEDDPDTVSNDTPPSPETLAKRTEALQSLRQKKYNWLEGQNRAPSTAMSQSRPPNAPPETGPSSNHTSTGGPQPSPQNPDIGSQDDGCDVEEDELGRMMEEELAQG